MTKKMKLSLLLASTLGVVCIVGSYIRSGYMVDVLWMFSLWYNRVLLGFILGLPWPHRSMNASLFRGAFVGLLVSFAFYSATGFVDSISFIAGIFYGMIIEYALKRAMFT